MINNFSNNLTIIAAIDQARGIGCNDMLCFQLDKDLAHFQRTTKNSVCIVGNTTLNSIGKLNNRTVLGVSKSSISNPFADAMFSNLLQAIKHAHAISSGEIFIIGGAQIYQQALAYTDKLIISHIKGIKSNANRFFPEIPTSFSQTSKTQPIRGKDAITGNYIDFTIIEYHRTDYSDFIAV